MHTSPHSTQHTHKKNVERRTTNCRKKNKLKKTKKRKEKPECTYKISNTKI